MTKKLDEIPPEESRSFDKLVNFTDAAVDHLLGITLEIHFAVEVPHKRKWTVAGLTA